MAMTNAQMAYQIIKEKIITLEMSPGSLIQERDLMEELSLGRTPIREALQQLEAERLVVVAPRRGMFVTDVQITDLQQIYEMRLTLEGLCVRLAAERATTQHITDMESCSQQMDSGGDLDAKSLVLIDRRFHLLLAEAAQNSLLMGEVKMFYNLALRLWHMALNGVRPVDLDTGRHQAILQAVKARDAGRAEELMRQHIHSFHETVRVLL